MIVLASKSPRRKELLSLITKDFIICESNFDESLIDEKNPLQLVKLLSYYKALTVQKNYPNDIIIGSDTIVCINNQILGKPKNIDDAKRMLTLLSNSTHEVITGLTILSKKKKICLAKKAKVYFKKLNDQEIDDYINSLEPFDKAGAYAIQGLGSKFIKKINGDYFTIVGLPVNLVYESLIKLGVKL
ncbi:MAG: Maf family protein [Bacilli bacterium]|nr:Maf family protein [Bacilli bacterium]